MNFFKRKLNKIELLIIIAVGTGLSFLLFKGVKSGIDNWNSRPVICSTTDGQKVYGLFDQVSSKWDDERKLAGSTSRVNLPERISVLQSVRREVDKQAWPECAQKAKKHLVKAMDSTIDGFIAFLDKDNPTELVQVDFEIGNSSFLLFKIELDKLKIPQKQE